MNEAERDPRAGASRNVSFPRPRSKDAGDPGNEPKDSPEIPETPGSRP